MKSHVTSDGTLALEIGSDELARLRAFTRELTGIAHPTADDVKAVALAALNAFCGKGGRNLSSAKGVELTII